MDKTNEETAGNSKFHKRNRKHNKKCKAYKMTLKKRYSKALFIMAKIENNLRKGREDARDKNSRIECEQIIEEYQRYMKTLGKEPKEKRDKFLEEKGSDNINSNSEKKTIEGVNKETEIGVEQKPNEPKEGREIMANKLTANVPTTGTCQTSSISSTQEDSFPDDLRVVLASVRAKGLIEPVLKEWPDIELKLNDMLMYYLLHNKGSSIPRYKSGDMYQGFLLIECQDSYTKDFLCNSVIKISKQFPDLHLTIIPASEISLRSTKAAQSLENRQENKHKNSSLTRELLKDFDRENKAEMDYYKYLKTLEYYNTLETLSKGQRKKQRIYKNYIEKYEQQQQGREQPNEAAVSLETPQGFQLSVNYFEEDNKQEISVDEPAKENPHNLGSNKISEVENRILAKKRIRNYKRNLRFLRKISTVPELTPQQRINKEIKEELVRRYRELTQKENAGEANSLDMLEFEENSNDSSSNSNDSWEQREDIGQLGNSKVATNFSSNVQEYLKQFRQNYKGNSSSAYTESFSEMEGNLIKSNVHQAAQTVTEFPRTFSRNMDEIPQSSRSRNLNSNALTASKFAEPSSSNIAARDARERLTQELPECSRSRYFNTGILTFSESAHTSSWNREESSNKMPEYSRSRNFSSPSEFPQTSTGNRGANSSRNSPDSFTSLRDAVPGCSRLRNFNQRDQPVPEFSPTAQSSTWNKEVNNFNKMPECSTSRNFNSLSEFSQTSTGNIEANSRCNSPDSYTMVRDERDQESSIYSRSRNFNSTAVRMGCSRSRTINTSSLTSSEYPETFRRYKEANNSGNYNGSDDEGIDNEMTGYSQSRNFNQTAQKLVKVPQTFKRNMKANYPCNSNDFYEKMSNDMMGCSKFNVEAQTYTEFPQASTRNTKFDNENALYSRSRNFNSTAVRMADVIQECSRSRSINTSALATSEFPQTFRGNKEANTSWNSNNSYARLDNEMPDCSNSRNFNLTAQALAEFPRTLIRNMEENCQDSRSRNFSEEAPSYPEIPQAPRSNPNCDNETLLYSRSRNFDSSDLRSSEIAESSRRQNWNSNVSFLERDNENSADLRRESSRNNWKCNVSCSERDNENSLNFSRYNSSPVDVPAYSRRSQPPAANSKESHDLIYRSRSSENAHPSKDLEKEIVKAKLEQNILECLNNLNEELYEEEPEDILKELPKKVGDYPSSSCSKLKRKADDLQSQSSTSKKQVNSPLEIITISDDESDNSDIEEVIRKSENLRKDREEYYKALSYLKSLKSRNPLTLSEREIRLQEYYKRKVRKNAQNSHNKDQSERQRKPLWNSTKKSNPDLQIAIIDRNEKDFRIPEQCWYQIENRLRESLLREIEQTNNANIGQFDSMYWCYDIKIIQCENPESLEFIKRFIHNQDLYWPGTQYDVIPVRDLPKRSIVKVCLPPPMIEDQAALKLLKAQNSKFCTYDWSLMNSREREGKNGKDLYISISATCLERLRKRNGEIKYGTNTLQVILPPEENV